VSRLCHRKWAARRTDGFYVEKQNQRFQARHGEALGILLFTPYCLSLVWNWHQNRNFLRLDTCRLPQKLHETSQNIPQLCGFFVFYVLFHRINPFTNNVSSPLDNMQAFILTL
jgi:hypothetical protein